MNLPYAPIAHEGFQAAHFFIVRDQEISKDFYVRILGGSDATSSWRIPGSFSTPAAARHPTSRESFLKHQRT